MAFLFSFAHAIIINWRYCVRLSDRKSGAPRCSFWCPEPKSMQGAHNCTHHPTRLYIYIYIYYPSCKRPFPQKVFLPARDVLCTCVYIYMRYTAAILLHHYNVFGRMVIERFLQNGLYINRHPSCLTTLCPCTLYESNWCFSSILRQYNMTSYSRTSFSLCFQIQFHILLCGYLYIYNNVMCVRWKVLYVAIFCIQRKLKWHTAQVISYIVFSIGHVTKRLKSQIQSLGSI